MGQIFTSRGRRSLAAGPDKIGWAERQSLMELQQIRAFAYQLHRRSKTERHRQARLQSALGTSSLTAPSTEASRLAAIAPQQRDLGWGDGAVAVRAAVQAGVAGVAGRSSGPEPCLAVCGSSDLAKRALHEAYWAVARVKNPDEIADLWAYFCGAVSNEVKHLCGEFRATLVEDCDSLAEAHQDEVGCHPTLPRRFAEEGTKSDNLYQRFSRAHTHVKALLKIVASRDELY